MKVKGGDGCLQRWRHLLFHIILISSTCLLSLCWCDMKLEAREVSTGWNLFGGVAQGQDENFRAEVMGSRRDRNPIYLVPSKFCEGWH